MATYQIQKGDTLSQIAAKQGTTIGAIQALNPQITDINKIYAGASLNLPTAPPPTPTPVVPTPTPVVPTPVTPTPATPPVDPSVPRAETPQEEYDRLVRERYAASQVTEDPEAIRQATLKRFQAEIDAANQAYNQLTARARIAGEGRLGSARAISARSGLLGSARGEAIRTGVEETNLDIERGIEAERATKVASILTMAGNKAVEEIARQREAKEKGAEAYLEFLSGKAERKKTNAGQILQSFIDSQVEPTEEEYSRVARDLGMSVEEVKQLYSSQITKSRSAAAAKTAEEKFKTDEKIRAEAAAEEARAKRPIVVGEGNKLIDPVTGKTIAEGNPKDTRGTEAVQEDFDKAAAFINDNPEASYGTLLENIKKNTKLTDTDAKLLLKNRGYEEEDIVLDETQYTTIADQLFEANKGFWTSRAGEKENVKKDLADGEIGINGRTYKLTRKQVDKIISALDARYAKGD